MNKREKYSQNRTDTLIGAGMRADGNITFSGLLRIQGDVLGDVSCDADPQGALVVDGSGHVTGTIEAPHVIISGRVSGPVHSTATVEILQGACVAGDVEYALLDIHAGGTIEGSLTHRALQGDDGEAREPAAPATKALDMSAGSAPENAGGLAGILHSRLKLGAVIVLLAVIAGVVAVATSDLSPPPVASPTDSATQEAAVTPNPPARSGGTQDVPKSVAGDGGAPVVGSNTDSRTIEQESVSSAAEKTQETLVTVQGVNPAKPAGVFLVIGKEPSVMFRKKRQDPGEGTRIDFVQGATESVAIGRNEIFRVASGRDITIFYQGRKVTPKTIESGAWMSFVPQAAAGGR